MARGCRRVAFGALMALGVPSASLVAATDVAAQSPFARPWLGVALDSEGRGPGIRVGHVVRGSPADKAGIHEGDRILRVGETQVARGADVVQAVATYPVGAEIHVAFSRGGAEQSARATLALPAHTDSSNQEVARAKPRRRLRGRQKTPRRKTRRHVRRAR